MSPACLNQTWPNVENCVLWNTLPDVGLRTVESNSVPPYHVEPYCPFGIGEGYCNSPIEGSSYNCTIFKDMKCPCEPGTEACFATEAGDVLTPYYQYFEMPLYPDPTRDDLPRQMYNHTGLKITVNDPPPGPPGDFVPAIGVHLNGIVMLGPSEVGVSFKKQVVTNFAKTSLFLWTTTLNLFLHLFLKCKVLANFMKFLF